MPNWRMLSALFDGVYVGDPEDILNRRRYGDGSIPLYNVRVFGIKLAEIRFLGKDEGGIPMFSVGD